MNEQGKNIFIAMKGRHIIVECADIDFAASPCHQFEYRIFQTLEVHIDINLQGIEGLGLIPVVTEFSKQHALHNRTRAVNINWHRTAL